MKKAKIMLLSLAVFTVLGAALAFKAKTYEVEFCTKTLPQFGAPAQSICDVTAALQTSQVVPGDENIYATSKDLQNRAITTTLQCTPELVCPSVRLAID